MERVTVRQFSSAARLIHEDVVIVYTYPRNHPLYGQEIELGIYTPIMSAVDSRAVEGIRPGEPASPEPPAATRTAR